MGHGTSLYSIFHAARALLYSKGFREQSHRGLLAALRQLYAQEIPRSLLDDFRDAMEQREAADYGLVYSEEGARDVVESAETFLEKSRSMILKRFPTAGDPPSNLLGKNP